MSVRFERDYSQQPKNVKIAMNKSLLKEFNKDNERVVYLEDGDEFQIQIFNDQDTEIGAKIYVNNELIGNSYLVIKPGERVWLDRYLDKARKFKFSTYEVNGNNEAVKKAIAKNGMVKVELFKKKETFNWTPVFKTYPQVYEPHIYYCNEPYSTSATSATKMPLGASVNYCSSINYSASSGVYTTGSASTCTQNDLGKTRGISAKLNNNKIETGRIQEGGYSNQEFDYVNMEFECWAFDTEQIHIMPKSTKPVYAEELQKTYCYNCGRKLKSKFNFCPFCGAKL
jgi:hypothetical protein